MQRATEIKERCLEFWHTVIFSDECALIQYSNSRWISVWRWLENNFLNWLQIIIKHCRLLFIVWGRIWSLVCWMFQDCLRNISSEKFIFILHEGLHLIFTGNYLCKAAYISLRIVFHKKKTITREWQVQKVLSDSHGQVCSQTWILLNMSEQIWLCEIRKMLRKPSKKRFALWFECSLIWYYMWRYSRSDKRKIKTLQICSCLVQQILKCIPNYSWFA